MLCPVCGKPVSLPASHWPSQWPPYVCPCGAHWGHRVNTRRTFEIPNSLEPLEPLMSWQQATKWAAFNYMPYVYAITYPNGLPFYVGKGNGARLLAHAGFLRLSAMWQHIKPPRDEKEAVLWQLAIARSYERYAILAICSSDREAFEIEAVAIEHYGRRERDGILCNATQAIEAPAWPMPTPPELDEVLTDGDYPWVICKELCARYATNQGLVVWCKKCDNPALIVRQKPITDLRCPICFHYFEMVSEEKLRKWIPENLKDEYVSSSAPIE